MNQSETMTHENESGSFSLTGFIFSALAVLAVGLAIRRLFRSEEEED